MSTPTLDAYRAANPADQRPDSEVIPSLVSQLQQEGTLSQFPDLVDASNRASTMDAAKPPLLGEALRGAVAGTHTMEAKAYSTAALVGGLSGNQGLREWGLKGYNQKMSEAAAFAPSVGSFSQINSGGDALRYGLGFAGGVIPNIAAVGGATAAGAIAGSAIGPEGTIGGGLAGLAEGLGLGSTLTPELAGGAIQALGATAGGTTAMATQSQNYGELVNQGSQHAESVATGVGLLGGVLQAYVPGTVLGKIFGNTAGAEGSSAVNSVLTKAQTALPGLGQYLAKDMAREGGKMAVANTATELATIVGEEYANRDNPNYTPMTGDQIKQRLVEAAASGTIMGAGFGALETGKSMSIDKDALSKGIAAENAKQANQAATYAAMQSIADPYGQPTGAPPAVNAPWEPEASPITEPISTPPSAAFAPPDEPTAPIVSAPVTEQPQAPWVEELQQQLGARDIPMLDNPDNLLDYLNKANPDLAKAVKAGQAKPEDVIAAINPAEPATPPNPTIPAGTPVETTPPVEPERPPAPVEFLGHQETGGFPETIPLWNLTEDIPSHPKGSTVSSDTLDKLGFKVPDAPPVPPFTTAAAPVNTDMTPGNKATWQAPATAPIEAPESKAPEVPVEKLPVFSTTPIQDKMPELRVPPTHFNPGAGYDEIAKAASTNLRQDERSVSVSKKLLAVYDRDTESTKLLPLFLSTGAKWRVALSAEEPEAIMRKIADKMGYKVGAVVDLLDAPGAKGDLVRAMFGDESSRVKKDPFVDELLTKLSKKGDQRYVPMSTLDTMEPISRRVFEFKDMGKYQQNLEEQTARLIPKSAVGGHAAPDATLEKLKSLSPDHARLAQVLASTIESEREKIPSLREAGEADGLSGILRVPGASEISEKLGAATKPEELIRKFGPTKNKTAKWMGLFDDDLLDAATSFAKDPKILDGIPELTGKNPQEKLLNFFKGMALEAGFKDWKDYLVKASKLIGERERGSELSENVAETGTEMPAKPKSAELAEDQSHTGAGSMRAWDAGKAYERPVSKIKIFDPSESDARIGGLTISEFRRLQDALMNGVRNVEGDDEEPGLESFQGNTVLEAREQSSEDGWGGPGEDAEFEDSKSILRDFLDHVFETSRGKDSSMMSDEELYKVYSALDRASRNTMPAKDDYRETNSQISDRYRSTVSTLLGLGVDVNLIEPSLDSQAHLLTQEMEQVQFGDARRVLIQTMSDIEKPSMENLRTTLHGAAHILFYQESPSVRALLLDAVDRMTNVKLDVFSKTRDDRIAENSSSLTGSLLAEEVLAEHMSYFGLKQNIARDLAGKFIGALKQIYLRGAILWAQLRGYALDPKIAQDYMEGRMTEFVDKTLNSQRDLDVMTGNVVTRAAHTATLFRPINGEWERSEYDPLTGNTVIKDVIPNGRMETLFNLDNHLQFHEYVIRNTQTDKPTVDYFKEKYGVSTQPSKVTDMLDKIEALHAGAAIKSGGELKFLIKGIKENARNLLSDATIRFASTDEDFASLRIETAGDDYQAYERKTWQQMQDPQADYSPGAFNNTKNEILINPLQSARYDSLGAAYMLLHETMHVGTTNAIALHEQYQVLGRDMEAFRTLNPTLDAYSASSILASTDRLNDIYEGLRGEGFYPGAYGMVNLHEFASEVMTNRMFQIKLGNRPLPRGVEPVGKLRTAWNTVVHLITGMWTRGVEKGNAFEESVKAVESVMRSGDSHLFAPTDSPVNPRAPMTQKESNDLVRKDYEYRYAEHNSWIDLINERLTPLAKTAGVSVADYMQRIFGVSDPTDSLKALEESLSARKDPLTVNKDQRLSDSKGSSNQLPPGSVRDNVVKSVLSHAQDALIRLDEIHDDVTRRIPRYEQVLAERTDRFSKWESKLNDLTSIRDDIVKSLKAQLGSLQRNLRDATFWSTEHHGLAGVAADLFGVKGAYGMPQDVVKMLVESATEAGHTEKTTGFLSYISQHNVDVSSRTPSEFAKDLTMLFHRDEQDPRLAPFVDGSPKAKADLAVALFAAKTSPENSMLLGIRSESDMKFKQLLVTELKNSVRNATADALPLSEMVKLSEQRRARLTTVRQLTSKYRASLEQAKEDLDNAALVSKEAAKAKTAMQMGIEGMQKEHNIQAGSFYPSHGAPIILTPEANGETKMGTLSLLQKDQTELIGHIFDNKKWLDQNQGMGGPLYAAVKSQFQQLKAVAGGYFQSNVQKSLYARVFESMGTRLRYTGNPTAKMAADMIDRYVNVDRSAEKLTFIGRDVTKALGETRLAWGFEKNYDGFIRTVFNPTCHFLEHFDTKQGDEGTAEARGALQRFLASKPETGKWMRDNPEAFDKLWNFYNKNLEANHGVRDLAASDVNKSPVLVKDPTLPIKDPFSGRVGPSYRRALDTGYGTTQRDLAPLFELKRTLDSVKSSDGKSVWTTLPSASEGPITPDIEKALFTPQVIDKFVRPYTDDVSSLHFPAPRLEDGTSYAKANPINVQQSWHDSGADLRKFSQALYEREAPLKPSSGGPNEYHQDILRFLAGQYRKIHELTAGQEDFEKRGFGPDFIQSNMMDTRKAEDFPPEFTKYRIYDHISLQQMVNTIAAHGTMGRDLGLFDGQNDRNHGITWMFEKARQEIAADHNTLLTSRSNILRDDPRLASKEVERRLKTQFGDKEYTRLNNLQYAGKEIDDVEKNLWGALTAANGSTRAFSAGTGTLQLMTEFMLNNFRSVLTSSNRLIAPMQVYGAGRLGRAQVIRSFVGSGRAVMGSFVQALAGDARLSNEYDRAVHNSGVGLDRANFMTPSSIIADSGKNNMYESQKYLGTIRKLRDIVFNTGFKPQDAEERIAPALRPQAPYSMLSESMDLGVAGSEAQYYNDVFKGALAHYRANPMDAENPAFKFTRKELNPNMPLPMSDANMERMRYQMQTMGSTLELEARDLYHQENRGGDLGDVIVPKHLMPLIVSQGLSDIALENDINKGPGWMYNTKFGRYGMLLMKWATLQMNQVVGMAKTRDGEVNWQHGKALAITMAAGIIPASMCISLLIDEYDEHVLGKKSNMIGFNWDSPSQTAAALMERTSRIGTFGLLGDVANGLRVYGSDGDTRGISFDQRVVFMNTLMSTMSLVNTAVHQDGKLTYDTFWRPLLNTVGGNSLLQYGQIMNKVAVDMGGTPILQSEWEVVTKLNALNYLRGGARVSDVPIRAESGDGFTSTPMHPYLSKMVLAAYANNGLGFQEAYQSAVEEARNEGEADPEEAVKRSFANYQPLKAVFQSMPTQSQISRIMLSLSDKGRQDVSAAIQSYDRYAALLGIKSSMTPQGNLARNRAKPSPMPF